MCEEHYILLEKNEEEKVMIVERKIFALGSPQALKAREEETKWINEARENKYKAIENGEVIYDPELVTTKGGRKH